MTNLEAGRNVRVASLMARYCQLGRLLENDIHTDDAVAVAEAKLILAEMARTKAEIDALLGRPAT